MDLATATPNDLALAHAANVAAAADPENRKFQKGDNVKVTHGDWGNNFAMVLEDEGDNGEVKCLIQCREAFIHRDELKLD